MFNSDLEKMKKENPEKNSDHKKNTLCNINMLYKLTQAVISFMMIDDYVFNNIWMIE